MSGNRPLPTPGSSLFLGTFSTAGPSSVTPPPDEIKVVLPSMIWGQIVLAAAESEDDRLRQLVEQAVAAAGSLNVWKTT